MPPRSVTPLRGAGLCGTTVEVLKGPTHDCDVSLPQARRVSRHRLSSIAALSARQASSGSRWARRLPTSLARTPSRPLAGSILDCRPVVRKPPAGCGSSSSACAPPFNYSGAPSGRLGRCTLTAGLDDNRRRDGGGGVGGGVGSDAEPQHAETAGSGCVGGRKLSWIALAVSGPAELARRACDIAHPVSRYRFASEATAWPPKPAPLLLPRAAARLGSPAARCAVDDRPL